MAAQRWCEGYYYIDAFAGPGAHVMRSSQTSDPLQQMFRGAAEHVQQDEGQKQFLAGSPRVALETTPPFTTYVFVEKSEERVDELRSEERRVGKECRCGWWQKREKNKW